MPDAEPRSAAGARLPSPFLMNSSLMNSSLQVAIGHCSEAGRKPANQDFVGSCLPAEPQRRLKGVAVAIADGISSSPVGGVAAETAVKSFLEDYYCTSEAWSVRTAGSRVLTATNAWLHAQSQSGPDGHDRDRGYVCTFSALVIKAATAHLFHAGDTRIYRLHEQGLESLTQDHRVWLSESESQLSRALGANATLELDYRALPVNAGDLFLLATDGVYEHVDAGVMLAAIRAHPVDLDAAARAIVDEAFRRGSGDNLSIQIVRVEELACDDRPDLHGQIDRLPFAPQLEAGARFDGYRVVRALHSSSRSHAYLAIDEESGERAVLKTPSLDLRSDPAYLERFLTEEWIARRVHSVHVIAAAPQTRERNFLYIATEFVEGQTLAQWLIDNPRPELESVRRIVEQIARGLYALHRAEVLHQDVRPENVMIDSAGTVKLIDLGAARVAGLVETSERHQSALPGTAIYMAPEYFLGEVGTVQSDLYSLGVLTYHMLSGRFPYGTEVAKAKSLTAQRRLRYCPLSNERANSRRNDDRTLPAWVDDTLRRALQLNPDKRYRELSEFVFDLRHPNPAFANGSRSPLLQREPVLFWQSVSAILAAVVLVLLAR
jgi:serine/threonine protein phosphatase PrpC/predicted Ser/Thr protein kinase